MCIRDSTDAAYAEEVAALRKEWWTEVERLDNCTYTDKDSFIPEINDANRECVEKYIEDTGCKLCQTAVLGTINKMIDDDAIVCAAAGSLPGDMQGLWRARKINTYHMEYGYSCMGYELSLIHIYMCIRDSIISSISKPLPSRHLQLFSQKMKTVDNLFRI